MLAQEISPLPLHSAGPAAGIPESVTAPPLQTLDPFDCATAGDPVAADAAWDPLLTAVAGYLLMAVGRVHQLFPLLQIVKPVTLLGLLALALYATDRCRERRLADGFAAPTKWLVALLIWMILSVPGALVLGTSVDVVFGNFLKTALMYVIVVGAIRGRRDVERLMMVYLISATIYAAVILSRFDLGSGDAWRLGKLYYYDANDFATLVVTAMPFGLYFLHAGRRILTRLFAVASLAVLALAFVHAGSRGGFIALVAVTIFIVVRYTAVAFRWRIAATAIIALVVVGAASDQYWKQMGTIMSDADYNLTEETGRMQIWRRGVGYMLDNPVFGVGAGNFQAAEGMLSPLAARQQFGVGVRWNAPHSIYVQAGAELGIPGLAILIGLIVTTFRTLERVNERVPTSASDIDDGARAVTRALTASLLAFVVGACFLSLAYAELFYTLVAFSVGLHKAAVAESS